MPDRTPHTPVMGRLRCWRRASARRAGLLLAVCFLLAGCAAERDEVVIKLAHGLDQTHPVHLGMAYMGERLAEKSGGTMRIEIYPSGQLGSERENLELLQIGSLGMTKVSASVLESFVPEFQVFGLPYIFRSEEHRFRVLEGEIGREALDAMEPYWLKGLTYYDAGSRSFYTTARPVHSPADLQGQKIRVQESATAMRMVRMLGGAPTPISWGELYTALQQGVVDGAENNPPSFHLSRHYEVARYYAINEHSAVPDVLVMSSNAWNDLNEQQRRWVMEAAEESAEHQKGLWRQATEEALRAVEAAGVEIIYPDREPFAARVADIFDAYRDQPALYALIQRIQTLE
jgi:tripartite ATP-independent transporter DctP family solute receptor